MKLKSSANWVETQQDKIWELSAGQFKLYMYGPTFLRAPNKENLKHILEETVAQVFPSCIGSLECMHWTSKNCPTELSGKFESK